MPTRRGDLVGWKLCGAGVLTFLFPLVLAIAGAIFAGSGQTRQVTGAVIGLVVGVILAVVIVRLLMKANKSPKNCNIEEIEEHR